MNNQVAQQCNCAENEHDNREPVGGLLQTFNSGSFGDGSFTVSCCQSESSSASADLLPRVGADQNPVDSHASKVGSSDAPSIQGTGSGSCPCGELTGFGNHGERVSGGQLDAAQPTDNNGSEWVMNGNALDGENHLGANQENPENSAQSCCVEETNCCISVSASDVKSNGSHSANQDQNTKVNPTGSRAINISFGHVPNATPAQSENLSDLLAKKGN